MGLGEGEEKEMWVREEGEERKDEEKEEKDCWLRLLFSTELGDHCIVSQ